jgi:hypothetical protein
MANDLQLSSRQFVQHHAFLVISFDMFAHNHATTSIYVRCKVYLVDVAQTTILNQENLAFQVRIVAL